jgi:acyl carrier protein
LRLVIKTNAERFFIENSKQEVMSTITERVTKIIADKLVIDASEVTAEANFKQDLGADSIDLVELIMEFEREFELSIPDEKAEEIQTVGNAIHFLEEAINA